MSVSEDSTVLIRRRVPDRWVSSAGARFDPADTLLILRPRGQPPAAADNATLYIRGGAISARDATIYIPRQSGQAVPARAGVARLFAIASSFLGAQLVSSVLGAVFWSLSARSYSLAQVGVGSAAISSMNVLGTLGMLGLGTLLMTTLPTMPRHHRAVFLRAALVTVAVASAVLALGWAVITHWLSVTLRPIGASPTSTAMFTAGVVLFGVTSTVDFALMAEAGGLVQFARNLVASLVKLALVPVFIAAKMTDGMTIYLAWAVGLAVSLPVCYRHLRLSPDRERFSGYRELRQRWRDAAGHHVLNLALQIPTLVLPVLAAVVTSSEDTARFTTARLAASFFFIIPYALPIALLAQSSGSKENTYTRIRSTVPLGIALCVGLYAIAAPLAGIALAVFGKSYAGGDAAAAFRIMTLAGVAFVIKDHYVAVRRVEGRMTEATAVIIVGTAAEIAFALAGGHIHGIQGLCWGWVIAVMLEGLAVTPAVVAMMAKARRSGRHARVS